LELLDRAWRRADLDPLITGTAIMISFALVAGLMELPLSAYRTFVIEHRYGFNRTTPRIFVGDQIKQAGLALALGIPLGWTLLYLMTCSGTLWWLYAWAVWTLFTAFLMWAYPILIAPLFNRFTALEDPALKERIVNLLERNGFSSSGIYVMDGSRRSGHGNAYFTGLGRAKRIVFFDTLLRTLNAAEIEAVLAHELGHFKFGHVRKQLLASTAVTLAGFALMGWLSGQAWFYHGLGVGQPSAHMALLLFLIAAPVFSFAFRPLFSYWRRRHEFEADDYAARHASPGALTDALVRLYQDNASTLTPDPLYSAYHDSHPPAPVRIARLRGKLGQIGASEPAHSP